MTNTETLPDLSAPIRTDDDLVAHVAGLLIEAYAPRGWLLTFDAHGRPKRELFQLDDMPADPRRRIAVEGVGEATCAELFAVEIAAMCDASDADEVVMVWERPGEGALSETDVAWIRGIDEGARRVSIPLRAQVLLTSRGARLVRPTTEGAEVIS